MVYGWREGSVCACPTAPEQEVSTPAEHEDSDRDAGTDHRALALSGDAIGGGRADPERGLAHLVVCLQLVGVVWVKSEGAGEVAGPVPPAPGAAGVGDTAAPAAGAPVRAGNTAVVTSADVV